MRIKFRLTTSSSSARMNPPLADHGPRILIGRLGRAPTSSAISAIINRRLTIAALQSFVCSLLDSTYPVVLADMGGTANRAIGIDYDWLKARAINGIRCPSHSRVATTPRSRLPREAPGAHLAH